MLIDFLRLQADLCLTQQDFLAGVLAGGYIDRVARPAKVTRPVVTLPGFAASAKSHKRLVGFLNTCGYPAQTFAPGIPQNESIPEFVVKLRDSLGALIGKLSAEYGQSVALVGHSAGGLYAREYAALYPQGIDRVITLGSPTSCPESGAVPNRALEYLVKRMAGTGGFEEMSGARGLRHWANDYPEIPYVAICSPVDGAVSEDSALIPAKSASGGKKAFPRENLRVYSSHFGMANNPLVLLAVADRLAEGAAGWTNFDPHSYFPQRCHVLVKALFPSVGAAAN